MLQPILIIVVFLHRRDALIFPGHIGELLFEAFFSLTPRLGLFLIRCFRSNLGFLTAVWTTTSSAAKDGDRNHNGYTQEDGH